MINVGNDWQDFFDAEQAKPYYKALKAKLREAYSRQTVYPPMDEIFNAFVLTPFSSVKVVLVGQDPYHEEGQAMGLSFSVREGVQEPPSLRNIRAEIEAEDVARGTWSGDLTRWARQGVLLLNSTLTVAAHCAGSHSELGWSALTDAAIRKLASDKRPKVFMLWGSHARSKKALVRESAHLVLESAHPSPLSAYRGFFGNNHFALCNHFLESTGQEPIVW